MANILDEFSYVAYAPEWYEQVLKMIVSSFMVVAK
jgi:hypothetical protein